jgi:hypothetical protein
LLRALGGPPLERLLERMYAGGGGGADGELSPALALVEDRVEQHAGERGVRGSS